MSLGAGGLGGSQRGDSGSTDSLAGSHNGVLCKDDGGTNGDGRGLGPLGNLSTDILGGRRGSRCELSGSRGSSLCLRCGPCSNLQRPCLTW